MTDPALLQDRCNIKEGDMPTTLTAPPPAALPIDPPRKRWTRAQCEQLDQAGLLDQQSLELVEGELINKMGKNRPHVNAQVFVMGWLIRVFGLEFVNSEASIDVAPQDSPTNEPQPDLIVLNQPTYLLASGNPRPQDLHLVVEVSDTSLHFDLTRKAALYARAGIGEYWVLDVAGHRLFVHREPQAGQYASVVEYSDYESVAPLAAPQSPFLVSLAFPSAN